MRVGLVFFLFAIFDVWWQRKSYMKDMMMSKEEVKKEYKESEGDPHHKAKRKEMHHEILEGAQMEAVKDADVVVTNPDHVAVALKYDKDKDAAPRVIAKGVDFRAERIKALARERGRAHAAQRAAGARALARGGGPGDPRGAVRRGGRGAELRLRLEEATSRRRAPERAPVPVADSRWP